MNKKQYMAPATETLDYSSDKELLAVSSDWGISYGTVDEDGTIDPTSRDIDLFNLETLKKSW